MFEKIVIIPFALIAMSLTLEIISGDNWLPRRWWIGIKPEPICLACTKRPDWYFVPSEENIRAELAGRFDACMTSEQLEEQAGFQSFVEKRLPADINKAEPRKVRQSYCSERYWSEHHRWRELSWPYGKAMWRLETAVAKEDPSMFWNQIVGGLLHAGACLLSLLVCLFMYRELQQFVQPEDSKQRPKM